MTPAACLGKDHRTFQNTDVAVLATFMYREPCEIPSALWGSTITSKPTGRESDFSNLEQLRLQETQPKRCYWQTWPSSRRPVSRQSMLLRRVVQAGPLHQCFKVRRETDWFDPTALNRAPRPPYPALHTGTVDLPWPSATGGRRGCRGAGHRDVAGACHQLLGFPWVSGLGEARPEVQRVARRRRRASDHQLTRRDLQSFQSEPRGRCCSMPFRQAPGIVWEHEAQESFGYLLYVSVP